jgi:hydroxymethylpyrimidine kinase/phosphomethylpyrimidine kinase
MVEYRPTLWIMGGLDPLGASGVSLDLRMVAQRPVHSCVFVTRLTVQTFTTFEEGLQADNSLFLAQCLSLKYATPPQALKLGMLGSEAQWEQLLEALSGLECPLVFDPIISTSSGNKILNNSHLSKVIRDLLPKVSLITPNLWEAELLVGFKIATDNDFVEAAKK